MRILRYPSLSEAQACGCLCAFVEALAGELSGVVQALRKLSGTPKGGAFAFEIELDRRRYGCLLILERWRDFANAFGPALDTTRLGPLLRDATVHTADAQERVEAMNRDIDGADAYAADLAERCTASCAQTLQVFTDAQHEAMRIESLGPMTPEELREARRVFAADLSAR